MGYIKSACMRITSRGFKPSWHITEVQEQPGEHEWVTTRGTNYDGKPIQFAALDHKPMRVYATKKEAVSSKAV